MSRSERSQAHRFRVSLQMQARQYRYRLLTLLIILILPVAFWASMYLTGGKEPVPITIPTSAGDVEIFVPAKKTYPSHMGLLGITWAVSVAAFFTTSGSIEKDRRLVLCGYRPWQILASRFILLTGIALLVSVLPFTLYTFALSPLHPEIIWLASLLSGLIAMGIGLLVGAIIPRPTEGVLTLIGLIGIGMSIKGTAAHYFPTYPAQQLLFTGLFAEKPLILPFVERALLTLAILALITAGFWSYRIRIRRRNK